VISGSNGGEIVEVMARKGNADTFEFPVPMRSRLDCDFSYSGLKTSMKTAVEKLGDMTVTGEIYVDLPANFKIRVSIHKLLIIFVQAFRT
jgi:N6-L-threonylcarbamoyladenine synthase